MDPDIAGTWDGTQWIYEVIEQPTTTAGQRILLQDFRGNESYTVTRKDILAIEAESRAAALAKVRAGIEDDTYLMETRVGALHGPSVLDHVYAILDALAGEQA